MYVPFSHNTYNLCIAIENSDIAICSCNGNNFKVKLVIPNHISI